MYIDADFIIKAASLLSALGALVAAVVAVYKVLENNKKQNEFINAMQEEQTLICYGLRGALQGLVEQGCNGPCLLYTSGGGGILRCGRRGDSLRDGGLCRC